MPRSPSKDSVAIVPLEHIERRILLVRGQSVLLDRDLAALYEVETKTLNRAFRRNRDRFPPDFCFQLTKEECACLRYQTGTSNAASTEKGGRGGRRYLPYVFTEQGVAMLSSVLRSRRALQVNVAIMRTFVRLRSMLASHEGLARRLAALERTYDRRFRIVFDAIRALMSTPPEPTARDRIGFHSTRVAPRPRE